MKNLFVVAIFTVSFISYACTNEEPSSREVVASKELLNFGHYNFGGTYESLKCLMRGAYDPTAGCSFSPDGRNATCVYNFFGQGVMAHNASPAPDGSWRGVLTNNPPNSQAFGEVRWCNGSTCGFRNVFRYRLTGGATASCTIVINSDGDRIAYFGWD